MLRFVVNPLAAVGQGTTADQAQTLLQNVVECFEFLLPALLAERAVLLYDSRLEQMPIIAGEPLVATLGRLGGRTGPDLRRRWYLYTRNRAKKLTGDDVHAVLEVVNGELADVLDGDLPNGVVNELSDFLSLGGTKVLESPLLRLVAGGVSSERRNAHDRDSLSVFLPKYVASPKHRKESYFDHERNESVAPMPLSDADAQEVLLCGVQHKGDYWGYHSDRRAFFCFKATRGNEYHGFELPEAEVPAGVVQLLR